MNTYIQFIIISFLFNLIPISFGENETCKSSQLDCQPSKVIGFDESKLYYIKNQRGYLCHVKGSLNLGDPTEEQNNCLFKIIHIEHGYYTIQIFATDLFIGTQGKSLDENQLLQSFSPPIDTFMQFKFRHLRDGWYEVLVRRTSKVWYLKMDNMSVFQTSDRTEGRNQLFRLEQYYD